MKQSKIKRGIKPLRFILIISDNNEGDNAL